MKGRKMYLSLLLVILLVLGSTLPAVASSSFMRMEFPERGETSPIVDMGDEDSIKTFGLNSFGMQSSGGLIVQDLTVMTKEDLVEKLLGAGVTVSNISFKGANVAAGTFIGGANIIGFDEGIILSTGDVAYVVGPNNSTGAGKSNGTSGDSDLNTLIPGYNTLDAAVLEFDFIPETNVISFMYVFASEEYNEYVGGSYNDVFGFFVNGVNVALIPGSNTPVSINNVNLNKNSEYYIDNTNKSLNTQMDGLTVVLPMEAEVKANEINHIKLAIADAGDSVLDSVVFIKAGSFSGKPIEHGEFVFSNPTYSVDEDVEGGVAKITVLRNKGSDGAVSVAYHTSSGSATEGLDYIETTGVLNFADGETSKSFDIYIINDDEIEEDETVHISLSNPTGGAKLGELSTAILTIYDDDIPMVPQFSFCSEAYSVDENVASGVATIKVILKGNLEEIIDNEPAMTPTKLSEPIGKIEDEVEPPLDEAGDEIEHPLVGGEEDKKEFPIIDDEGEEEESISSNGGNETEVYLIDSLTNYLMIETVISSISSIKENEENVPLVDFKVVNGTVTSFVYGDEPSMPPPIIGTVMYSTSNGSATADLDYIATSGTLTFEKGETVKTFTIPIIDDNIYEGNETVILTLSNPTEGIILGKPSTAVLTIIDNEKPPSTGGSSSKGTSKSKVTPPVEVPPEIENLPLGTIVDRMPGYIILSKAAKLENTEAEIVLEYDMDLLKANLNHSPRIYYWNLEKKKWVALATYHHSEGKVTAINVGDYKGWFTVFGVKEPKFSDLENHWVEETINRMNGLGIVGGYDKRGQEPIRVAKPDQYVTRGEFSMFIYRLLNMDTENLILPVLTVEEGRTIVSEMFTDANEIDNWVVPVVAAVTKEGLLVGREDSFQVNAPITTKEAATMVSKALELIPQYEPMMLDFLEDVENLPQWVKNAVIEITVEDYLDDADNEDGYITRAEAVTALHMIFVKGMGW